MNSIIKFAELIHRELDLDTDFDIIKFVNDLGGKVEFEYMSLHQFYKIVNCKATPKDKEFLFIIKVNNELSDEKKRMAIAGALANLLIHMGFIDEDKWTDFCNKYPNPQIGNMCEYNNISISTLNIEIRQFTAGLLLPEYKFVENIRKNTSNSIVDLNKVAKDFKTTIHYVDMRGKGLLLW